MYIYNTTNLLEFHIRTIAEIVKPPNTPEVLKLSVRNKMEGYTHGNWGKFYPITNEITLCVPQDINELTTSRSYTKKQVTYKDRYDFLAAVLGHEYYHAWQWNNKKELWHCKEWLEVEAEEYEPIALQKWIQHIINDNIKIDDHGMSQSVNRQVKYSDYRSRNKQ